MQEHQTPNTVLIRGEGIAALTAARLLSRNGLNVHIHRERTLPSTFILLTETTQWMLNDCWELGDNWWDLTHSIHQKQIIAAPGNQQLLPFHVKVVLQTKLQQTLQAILQNDHPGISWFSGGLTAPAEYTWILDASTNGAEHYTNFGTDLIVAMQATVTGASESLRTCSMIATTNGWLFIFPTGEKQYCIQMMQPAGSDYSVDHITALIHNTTGLSITVAPASVYIFPAAPQLANNLLADNLIKIGRAAAKYDPISGDGTGHALRSAVWASKIIIGTIRGNDAGPLLRHYETSLKKHFYEHLETRASFYHSKTAKSPIFER